MIFCARATRTIRIVLIGPAQWKIKQSPSLKREQASLEGSLSVRSRGPNQTTPAKESERAWKEHF
jgi:hypothetical protein